MKDQRIKKTFLGIKPKLIHFVAGAALSQVQFSWQAQHFRKVGAMLSQVRYRFRSRRSTFARFGTDFAAGAGLSQGAVQISRQAQHFCKRYQFRGRRGTFARYGAEFDAGAAFSQAVKKIIQRYKHEEKGRKQREREKERKKERKQERKTERKKERKKERKRVMIEEAMI